MSLRIQAARGLKWQAVEIGGRQVLSLIVFTTLARLLNPSDFGLVGLVGVYLAFVGMFVNQGLGAAIVQRKNLEAEHIDAAFWCNIFSATTICAATIFLAAPVAGFFKNQELRPLLQWASLSLVINAAAGTHQMLFLRDMDFRTPAMRTLVGNVVGGTVGVGMAFSGCGVWALLGQQLGASIASSLFIWAASTWRPRMRFSPRHFRDLLPVSSGVLAVDLLWLVSTKVDQLFVGRLLGPVALGQYVVGFKVSDLAKTALYQPLGAVAFPTLARLQHDLEKLRSAIYRASELNAVISFPCLVGLACIAPELVAVLFGAKWEPAGLLLALSSILLLVNGLQAFFHSGLLATGGPGEFVAVNALHSVGAIAACWLGIAYGPAGVLVGLITNESLMSIPRFLCLWRRTKLDPMRFCRPLVAPCISAAAMALALLVLRRHLPVEGASLIGLGEVVVIGALVYSATLSLLSPGSVIRLTSTGWAAIKGRSATVQGVSEG